MSEELKTDPLAAAREMLVRWSGWEYYCRCDSSVGFVCEWCHNTQVVRDLVHAYEDVADLLAERDPTLVDAEWLDRVMGPGIIGMEGKYTEWLSERGLCEVTLFRDGLTLLSHKCHILKHGPTRGDVLTALRLFGGKRQ